MNIFSIRFLVMRTDLSWHNTQTQRKLAQRMHFEAAFSGRFGCGSFHLIPWPIRKGEGDAHKMLGGLRSPKTNLLAISRRPGKRRVQGFSTWPLYTAPPQRTQKVLLENHPPGQTWELSCVFSQGWAGEPRDTQCAAALRGKTKSVQKQSAGQKGGLKQEAFLRIQFESLASLSLSLVKIRRYFTTSSGVVYVVTNTNVASQHALFSW